MNEINRKEEDRHGVTKGRTYYYVKAYDGAGNLSAKSNPASTTEHAEQTRRKKTMRRLSGRAN